MLRIIKSTWIRTLIAFDVRDPLKRTDVPYVLPADFGRLPGDAKLRATICSLFGNHKHPIEDIARAYEMAPNEVISILISEGLIKEQRRNTTDIVKGGRRSIENRVTL